MRATSATAAAVVEAFQPELEEALEHPVDFKSTLQERLAQRGAVVDYDVVQEQGPAHDRTFTVQATVDGDGRRPGQRSLQEGRRAAGRARGAEAISMRSESTGAETG